ncbi:MAG: T9SS type A sorting domain-containing protein [Bacteroidota bacterium]|nr:T9SS type A sorting domain-containing protein [Bacteroidota bacterium]
MIGTIRSIFAWRSAAFLLLVAVLPLQAQDIASAPTSAMPAQLNTGVELAFSSPEPIQRTAGEELCFELVAKRADSVATDWAQSGFEITLVMRNTSVNADSSMRSWNDDPEAYSWSQLMVAGQEITAQNGHSYTIPQTLFVDGRADACYRSSKAEEGVQMEIQPGAPQLSQLSPRITWIADTLENILVEVTAHAWDSPITFVYLMRPMQIVLWPRDRFLNVIDIADMEAVPLTMTARFPGELKPPSPRFKPSLLDAGLMVDGATQYFCLAGSERLRDAGAEPQRLTFVATSTPSVQGVSDSIFVERHMPEPFVLRDPPDRTHIDLRGASEDSVITLRWQRPDPPDPFTTIQVDRFSPATESDTVLYTVTFFDKMSRKSGAWTVSDNAGRDTVASITVGQMRSIIRSFFPQWTGGTASIIWFVKASDGLYDRISERSATDIGFWLYFDFGTLDARSPAPVSDFALDAPYPQPAVSHTTIPIRLPQRSSVVLTLHSLLGQEIHRITERQMEAGSHLLSLDTGTLPSGTYLLRLRTPEGVHTRFLTKM